ncbi:hypothetical protein OKW41_006130 [Paraburkholderia sp. UCT70]|uniref:hypothetical protein n=1 Tax=Paraburkholderia sp. UCT70 TaxID=2991068 RepID=UPI003D1DB939
MRDPIWLALAKSRLVRHFVGVSLCGWSILSVAQIDCGSFATSSELSKETDVKILAAVGRLTQSGRVGGGFEREIQMEIGNLQKDAPASDKSAIAAHTLYAMCTALRDRDDISTQRKFEILSQLIAASEPPRPTSAKPHANAPVSPAGPPAGRSSLPPRKADVRTGSNDDFNASLDALIARMASANIAFNAPSPINVEETADIELRLDLHKSPSELAAEISSEGTKQSAAIKVSDTMMAHLSGDGFTITPNTPETQGISGTEATVWSWQIRPKSAGKQKLALTLDAMLVVNGGTMPRAVRTFSTNIEVTVSPLQRVQKFAADYWQWVWTAVLVPIGVWIVKRRKSKPAA